MIYHSSGGSGKMNRPAQAEPGPVRVAIGVVRAGDSYLVGRRGPDSPMPGVAEFPGGKCLLHESLEACVLRECLEETGLEVRILQRLTENLHTYPHGRILLTFFLCEPVTQCEPRAPFRWVPRQELPELTFPDGNHAVLDQLIRPPDGERT
jgi:mutator protein MutT